MGAAALISAEEYLAAAYRPDCDFVDGEVLERNVGTKGHSKFQRRMISWFDRHSELAVEVFPEQRIRVGRDRYRVPDWCVTNSPEPDEEVFTEAPYICIEILSPDDSFPMLQKRLDDYISLGTPNIWMLDPASRRGWTVAREGHLEALDGIMRTSDGRVAMPIAELE